MPRGRLRPLTGATRPFGMLASASGRTGMGQAHAALPGGSLPVHQSRAGRPTAKRSRAQNGT